MITFKRTFIAVPVPPEECFLSLIRTAPCNVRPLHPQDLHITLAFLGDCDARQCNAIRKLLCADPPPPWKARLGQPCRFGNQSSAFGYPLTGDEIFFRWLQRQRPLLFEIKGSTPDPRPIWLHLTMAWRTGGENGKSAAWLSSLQRLSGYMMEVYGVGIYCSNDQRDGRRYRLIKHIACV